jgi:hypothetical protein
MTSATLIAPRKTVHEAVFFGSIPLLFQVSAQVSLLSGSTGLWSKIGFLPMRFVD